MFRTVPPSIIRSFSLYTQKWCMSHTFADIYHCCVQWKTPDDGQRNCPKHVDFHSKNKFKKLAYPVGFIIRNSHSNNPSCWTINWPPKSPDSNARKSFLCVHKNMWYVIKNWITRWVTVPHFDCSTHIKRNVHKSMQTMCSTDRCDRLCFDA